MDSLDKLLAQLKAEYDENKPNLPTSQVAKSSSSEKSQSSSLIDNLLAEVQADFATQDAAEELRKQQEIEQEKIHQAQIKAQQIEVFKVEATKWLETLDPFSPEGLWFERFAEGYPTKLDAAMEYLQSNQ
jgi:hypothetical protein